MRHEVPVLVPDPFLYAEKDGKKITMSTAFEVERIAEAGIEAHPYEEFGYDELLAEGKRKRFDIIARDLPLNACRAWGIEEAVTPWGFPAYVADHLRENGITLTPEPQFFSDRRRVKNEAELEGIRQGAGCSGRRDGRRPRRLARARSRTDH